MILPVLVLECRRTTKADRRSSGTLAYQHAHTVLWRLVSLLPTTPLGTIHSFVDTWYKRAEYVESYTGEKFEWLQLHMHNLWYSSTRRT